MEAWRTMLLNERQLLESRILIVDDNSSNVLLLERLLEWAGYVNVKSVYSGEEALRLYESYSPDLVMLDLHMPSMSGYEVMKRLQEKNVGGSFLPILVFTA